MAKRTITALYDSYEDAANAVRKLEGMGVSHSDISIVANNEGDRYSQYAANGSSTTGRDTDDTEADTGAGTGATVGTLVGGGAGLLAGLGLLAIPGLGPVVAAGWLITTITGAGVGAAVGGLVGGLVGAGVPEEHAHAYAEGVRRGGTLVTVRAEDTMVDRIVDVLDDHGSVDMDERETSWRSSGWSGLHDDSSARSTSGYTGEAGAGGTALGAAASTATGMTGTSTASMAGTDRSTTTGYATDYDRSTSTGSDMSRSAASTAGMGATGMGATGSTSTDRTMGTDREAIPVVEEDLRVGKREVSHGRVRIHSHVVETPVQEQVTLRDEHVQVERRPVDRAITDADRVMQDRTIEVEERDEEAVISKEARVKEELVIGKEVENRTETVSDTVRHTEVEVEDERGDRVTGTTGTMGTTDRNR